MIRNEWLDELKAEEKEVRYDLLEARFHLHYHIGLGPDLTGKWSLKECQQIIDLHKRLVESALKNFDRLCEEV